MCRNIVPAICKWCHPANPALQAARDSRIATADPPPRGIPNPIHDGDGAAAAGYAGALVAGVRTYGWAAETIARALGSSWRERGWVDVNLRRPLFAGERLTIDVAPTQNTARVMCRAGTEGRVVLDGEAGPGEADWLGQLKPPPITPAAPAPQALSAYNLNTVPLQVPLTPLGVTLSDTAARRLVAADLSATTAHYLTAPAPAPVHPYFLAGRVAPLTRHNFIYGPTIHVRSQIQHIREGYADRQITVGAQIVNAYERNGHWYQVLDAVVSDPEGALALIRHHTIFRPRGT